MILSSKTLEKLRDLINEETEYRKGPQLVALFNKYGFKDTYGQGFPSRKDYTDSRLSVINGHPEIDKCILDLFAPNNFIGRYNDLDNIISEFNKYLSYDGWRVKRNGIDISFVKSNGPDIDKEKEKETISDVDVFLTAEFKEINIDALPVDVSLIPYIESRMKEIQTCMIAKASLASIFLIGSTLEGILLGVASRHPAEYNRAKSSPKDKTSKKVRPFNEWTLNDFIETSYEIGFLKEDVKKFSLALRDFRNYIHPYEQMCRGFHPDENTAKICFQVLKAALFQIVSKQVS